MEWCVAHAVFGGFCSSAGANVVAYANHVAKKRRYELGKCANGGLLVANIVLNLGSVAFFLLAASHGPVAVAMPILTGSKLLSNLIFQVINGIGEWTKNTCVGTLVLVIAALCLINVGPTDEVGDQDPASLLLARRAVLWLFAMAVLLIFAVATIQLGYPQDGFVGMSLVCTVVAVSTALGASVGKLLSITSGAAFVVTIFFYLGLGLLSFGSTALASFKYDMEIFMPFSECLQLLVNCVTGLFVWGDLPRVQEKLAYFLVYVLICLGVYLCMSFTMLETRTEATAHSFRVVETALENTKGIKARRRVHRLLQIRAAFDKRILQWKEPLIRRSVAQIFAPEQHPPEQEQPGPERYTAAGDVLKKALLKAKAKKETVLELCGELANLSRMLYLKSLAGEVLSAEEAMELSKCNWLLRGKAVPTGTGMEVPWSDTTSSILAGYASDDGMTRSNQQQQQWFLGASSEEWLMGVEDSTERCCSGITFTSGEDTHKGSRAEEAEHRSERPSSMTSPELCAQFPTSLSDASIASSVGGVAVERTSLLPPLASRAVGVSSAPLVCRHGLRDSQGVTTNVVPAPPIANSFQPHTRESHPSSRRTASFIQPVVARSASWHSDSISQAPVALQAPLLQRSSLQHSSGVIIPHSRVIVETTQNSQRPTNF